ESEIVTCRGGNRGTAGTDLLSEQPHGRVGQVGAVELLTNHQVREEAAVGRYTVKSHKRHVEPGLAAEIVGCIRGEIARRGTAVQIPAVDVEPGDVLADLNAAKSLAYRTGAVEIRGGPERRVEDAGIDAASRDGVEPVRYFAADAANPEA